jgi:hypothetical protein
MSSNDIFSFAKLNGHNSYLGGMVGEIHFIIVWLFLDLAATLAEPRPSSDRQRAGGAACTPEQNSGFLSST